MKIFVRVCSTVLVALGMTAAASAQTKWDMPTPYPDGNFHTRFKGEGPWAELLRVRFHKAAKRYGLDSERFNVRTDLFRPPQGDQFRLAF